MPSVTLTAAAIVGGASIVGSKNNSKAVNKASDAATASAADNNALARDIYGQNKSILTPFIDGGVDNAKRLNALTATNPFSYKPGEFTETDPSYQFRLKQGLGAVTQNKAINGLIKSGSALKALNDYAQGSASQEYGAWYARDQARIAGENDTTSRYINVLDNQQKVGAAAGSALAGVGQNFVTNTSANNTAAANTVGNAALAGASNTNALIGQGVNALSYVAGSGLGQRGSSYAAPTTFNPTSSVNSLGALARG